MLGAADPWKELAQAGLLDVSQLSVLDTTVLLTEMGRHVLQSLFHAECLSAACSVMAGWRLM